MNSRNKISYNRIRRHVLHELANGGLQRKILMHRLVNLFDISERWLSMHVSQMISDGLIIRTGRTSCQNYTLTQRGYCTYFDNITYNIV